MVDENTETYRKYRDLESKMTPEMRTLMMDLLVHKYIYYEMADNLISDREYDRLEKQWEAMGVAAGLGEDWFDHYPFGIDFPHGHPLAPQAAAKAKRMLEEKRNS